MKTFQDLKKFLDHRGHKYKIIGFPEDEECLIKVRIYAKRSLYLRHLLLALKIDGFTLGKDFEVNLSNEEAINLSFCVCLEAFRASQSVTI